MKAIISTTYDSKYLFFLPIVTWCWNKLGVDVICFAPYSDYMGSEAINQIPAMIMRDSIAKNNLKCEFHYFKAEEHKKATYAQCSRLYAAALDLQEDEVLITSDVDMAIFSLPRMKDNGISVFGADLVPNGQYPICYISATKKDWKEAFNKYGNTYQECLDALLGSIEAEHFRGNYWAKDQEEAYKRITHYSANGGWLHQFERAKPGTQFATNRLDRDDAYLLERLNPEIIDYHMPRPGYEENNFNQILTVLQYFYPSDNFDWLKQYREQYIQLL